MIKLVTILLLISTKALFAQDFLYSKDTSILMDESLGADTQNLIVKDLNKLRSLQIAPSQPQATFVSLFGGSDSAALLSFLDKRVNVLYGQDVDFDDRLDEYKNGIKVTEALQERNRASVFAVNRSFQIWMFASTFPKDTEIYFTTKTKKLPIKDSRVGIVQLSKEYATDSDAEGSPRIWLNRVGALLHEARHSDCPAGITRSLINAVYNENDRAIEQWEKISTCGEPHISCPVGHPLVGLKGCDSRPFGAYSVSTLFALTIKNSCKNCSELEKQTAIVMQADGLSRLHLQTGAWSASAAFSEVLKMINGQYGMPAQTNLGVIEGK
jgi:hypothetical protein